MYYLINKTEIERQEIIDGLKRNGVHTVFHYVPLHSSAFGKKKGRTIGDLAVTEYVARNLIRLPLWIGLKKSDQLRIHSLTVEAIESQMSLEV